jgi:lysophospholipase L1-like esterase
MIKRGLWVVLILFAAGCSSGSGTAGSAPGAVDPGAPAATMKPIITQSSPSEIRNIVFLGDSITQYGTYPAVVARAVGENAVNAGEAGQTLAEMLARVNWSVIIWHPNVCVLLGGTNDAYDLTPPARFQATLVTLLDRLKASGITVVVVTPPHFAQGSSVQGQDLNTVLAPLVSILRAEAAQRGLTIAEVNNADVALTSDGEHPSAAGQATIAQIVTPAVESALGTH